MASQEIFGSMPQRDLERLLGSNTGKDKHPFLGKLWPFGKDKTATQDLSVSHQAETNQNSLPTHAKDKELEAGKIYEITDVFPHTPNESNPLSRSDIEKIVEWANHPDVAGHIYQLESDTSKLDLSQWEYFLLYYHGSIDDEGNKTNPNESTFFKAVHGAGQNETLLSASRIRWSGVDFVKAPRAAYWERVIVNPDEEFRMKKIGLTSGIETHLSAFYKYEGYGRNHNLPAREVRATTYADREAKGWERNEEYLLALGYEHHGEIRIANGRRIQPWRNTLETFEAQLPDALSRAKILQPDRVRYLEAEAIRLQSLHHDKIKDSGY